MNRKFIVSLLATLLLRTIDADAQQPTKVPRIAFLAGGSRSADSLLLETKNVVAEYRFAEGSIERLPTLAAELVRLNVDVIVGPGSGAAAAKNATRTIPIVVTLGDPVAAGLVASLARPGGNVTGLSAFQSELGGKQLELLKEAFPIISRLAVFWNQTAQPSVARDALLLRV